MIASFVGHKTQDWSDFIGCMEAEPDLSKNYKTYLDTDLIKNMSIVDTGFWLALANKKDFII